MICLIVKIFVEFIIVVVVMKTFDLRANYSAHVSISTKIFAVFIILPTE